MFCPQINCNFCRLAVTLQGVDQNGVPFKRFLLRATTDSDSGDTYSGNFTSYNNTRVRSAPECNNVSDSYLTNSDFSEKLNVTATWEAPNFFDGCISLR